MTDKSPPAFPVECGDGFGYGMTLRDYFATHAPITMKEAWTLWSSGEKDAFEECMNIQKERGNFFNWFVKIRLEYADAMLAERDKS